MNWVERAAPARVAAAPARVADPVYAISFKAIGTQWQVASFNSFITPFLLVHRHHLSFSKNAICIRQKGKLSGWNIRRRLYDSFKLFVQENSSILALMLRLAEAFEFTEMFLWTSDSQSNEGLRNLKGEWLRSYILLYDRLFNQETMTAYRG